MDIKNERRFFEAFTGNYPKPYWLVDVEPAPPILDVQGVDALTHVKYPSNGGVVLVPVQIKSTQDQVGEYYRLHPDAYRAQVVVLIVWRNDDFDLIRKRLYQQLELRRLRGIRFDAYMESLQKRPVTSTVKNLVRKISQRDIHRLAEIPAE